LQVIKINYVLGIFIITPHFIPHFYEIQIMYYTTCGFLIFLLKNRMYFNKQYVHTMYVDKIQYVEAHNRSATQQICLIVRQNGMKYPGQAHSWKVFACRCCMSRNSLLRFFCSSMW